MSSENTPEYEGIAGGKEGVIVCVGLLLCIMLGSGFVSISFGYQGSEALLLANIALILACGLSAVVIILGYFVLAIYSKE